MDGLGALIAGTRTPAGQLMAGIARSQFPGAEASLLVHGGKVSAAGAALANGFAGNALDIDDGYRLVKGHPGACVLPPLLAAMEMVPTCSGKDFLAALAVGYEVGIRAGLIRHALYACYHSSGSWGALAGVAAVGKVFGLDAKTLCHALGAAEYHAPIAPMMKGIDTPSMGKDSIGWGNMVAMLSVRMAMEGFTGIAPLFADTPNPEWLDELGREWRFLNLYFKPYAACRWAQPAVDGAMLLQKRHNIAHEDIRSLRIRTFAAACALNTAPPADTEEAQYNMAFPVAAALIDGEVGPRQVLPPRIFDKDLLDLMLKITTEVSEEYENAFPDKTYADVYIETIHGKRYISERMEPRWEPPDTLPSDRELETKCRWLVNSVLGESSAQRLTELIWNFDSLEKAVDLLPFCMKPSPTT